MKKLIVISIFLLFPVYGKVTGLDANGMILSEWGKKVRQDYVNYYKNLFAQYELKTKDTGQQKAKNLAFLKKVSKIYTIDLKNNEIDVIKNSIKDFKGSKDPLIVSQLAFILLKFSAKFKDFHLAKEILTNVENPSLYGDYVELLLARYMGDVIYNTQTFNSGKVWKGTGRAHADKLIKFLASNKNFPALSLFEIGAFFRFGSQNEYDYVLSASASLKDPWLKKLMQVENLIASLYYKAVKNKESQGKKIIDTLKEIYKLHPERFYSWAMLIAYDKENSKDWFEKGMANERNPLCVRLYYESLPERNSRLDFLKSQIRQSPQPDAIDFACLKNFCTELNFHIRTMRNPRSPELVNFYMEHLHPLAKKIEQETKEGFCKFGDVKDRIHNRHFFIAKILHKYSHIRKIHELYGDVINLERNDQRMLPFCYAITGPASGLVKKINEVLSKKKNKIVYESDVEVFKQLLEDCRSAREITNDKRCNIYFDFVEENVSNILNFYKGAEVRIKFFEDFRTFEKAFSGTSYEIPDENTLIMKTSSLKTQYIVSNFGLQPPYEINYNLSILSKDKKAIAGLTLGYMNTYPFSGRMVLLHNKGRIGLGIPCSSKGPFNNGRLSLPSDVIPGLKGKKGKKAKGKNKSKTNGAIKVQVWEGFIRIYYNDQLVETYKDPKFKPGLFGFATPVWLTVGGHYKYSNVSIKKINIPTPKKGYDHLETIKGK